MRKKLMLHHTVHVSTKISRIPKAIREQTWIRYNGEKYNAKCHVLWCQNNITPFIFEVGHNIPQSKGGCTEISNLRPICSSCNKSMGNKYTIDEFSTLSSPQPHRDDTATVNAMTKQRRWWQRCVCYKNNAI